MYSPPSLRAFPLSAEAKRGKGFVELEGPVHNTSQEYDRYWDSELAELGFYILRIKNEELKNMNEVLDRIKRYLDQIG